MSSAEKRPERALSMAWQTIDGETVLLHIDGKELLGLNEVGAKVWSLCDGEHTVSQIVDGVAAAFVGGADVGGDVHAFLEELDRLGALEWRT